VGIYAQSLNGDGIMAEGGPAGSGIVGQAGQYGVLGYSPTGAGVVGLSDSPRFAAIEGQNDSGHGMYGHSADPLGYGIYAENAGGGYSGGFLGDVQIVGNINKSGGGFTIDHPQEPETKYLSHAFVESPEMLNIYSGSVTTDGSGEAAVTLPSYFEA